MSRNLSLQRVVPPMVQLKGRIVLSERVEQGIEWRGVRVWGGIVTSQTQLGSLTGVVLVLEKFL